MVLTSSALTADAAKSVEANKSFFIMRKTPSFKVNKKPNKHQPTYSYHNYTKKPINFFDVTYLQYFQRETSC